MAGYQQKEICNQVLKKLDLLESKISQISVDQKFQKAQKEAQKSIAQIKNRTKEAVRELQMNEEWDTFTIAFYGETNAGKSTIIEGLRIFFEEETKQEQWKKFSQVQEEKEKEEKIGREKCETIREELRKQRQEFDIFKATEGKDLEELKRVFLEKEEQYQSHISSLGFWSKFLIFFIGDKEKDKYILAKKELKESENKYKKRSLSYEKNIADREVELEKQEKNLQEISEKYRERLDALADGGIIGDGRSDFTRKMHEYIFDYNGKKFKILDVPGIEGNESEVIEEIRKATKKAHAIFYITSESKPPQAGDKNKGTIEKIKEHLGSQTEVYAIYNKRINSTSELEGIKELVSDGEKMGLEELNARLREVLGEHYCGCHSLSAQIAFLALAKILVSSSRLERQQKKFLEKFTAQSILDMTRYKDFIDFLTRQLVVNIEEKITLSNTNKVRMILKDYEETLNKIANECIGSIYNEAREAYSKDTNKMNETFEKAKQRMNSSISDVLDNFENSVGEKVYDYIDRDVSDTDFKKYLENEIKKGIEDLQKYVPQSMQNGAQILQKEVKEIMENFSKKIEKSINQTEKVSLNIDHIEFNFDIKSGIDGWGLFGGLASGAIGTYWAITAINSWNPVGWSMAAWGAVLTILASILGCFKSIIKFFSSSYKMSEQRKATDKTLGKARDAIDDQIEPEKNNVFQMMRGVIDECIQKMNDSVEQMRVIKDLVETSRDEVKKMKQEL